MGNGRCGWRDKTGESPSDRQAIEDEANGCGRQTEFFAESIEDLRHLFVFLNQTHNIPSYLLAERSVPERRSRSAFLGQLDGVSNRPAAQLIINIRATTQQAPFHRLHTRPAGLPSE
jgi:hypothetical protein